MDSELARGYVNKLLHEVVWGPFLIGLGCLLRWWAGLSPAMVGPSVSE